MIWVSWVEFSAIEFERGACITCTSASRESEHKVALTTEASSGSERKVVLSAEWFCAERGSERKVVLSSFFITPQGLLPIKKVALRGPSLKYEQETCCTKSECCRLLEC